MNDLSKADERLGRAAMLINRIEGPRKKSYVLIPLLVTKSFLFGQSWSRPRG